jgi:hypothetical protein
MAFEVKYIGVREWHARRQLVGFWAAIATLLAIALYLVANPGSPISPDAATTLAGP